jgi:osmotically-inducible protein OsmY
MTTASLTETDLRVRGEVLRQLDWDPEVDASGIGVAAANGTVTLTGYIDTYAGKLGAERVAKRVRGVRAVANELEVRLKLARTDPEIATDVARALQLRSTIPENVQATVHEGRVTLTGTTSWLFQKDEAERVVRHVPGVRGVHNHVTVLPRATERDVRRRIVEALLRSADVDARRISVNVADSEVVLRGTVATWLQRAAAERAAAAAPGVTTVRNEILVEPVWEPGFEETTEIC